jgi:ABC-type phosphate transport system ATPase subunit
MGNPELAAMKNKHIPCPYPGLSSFTEKDETFFFGREGDTDVISSNLIASRLTVLYGPVGSGKSSVLRAGVISQLRRSMDSSLATEYVAEMLPV